MFNGRAFEISSSGKLPEEMHVFCLTMIVDTIDGNIIPEVRRTLELKNLLLEVLAKRLATYDTSIEEDEGLLQTELNVRWRMAAEVRLGEKRILKKAIERINAWIVAPSTKRQRIQ